MAIKVYNTLKREKEGFVPVKVGEVGIYLCGPTVYKPSHIGHAVGPVIFDAIRRWLEFRNFKVTMVVNITDVDDKIIDEANRQGRTMQDLAEEIAADYFQAMEKLNVRKPDIIPKATEHIPEIIALIQRLIEKDVAYAVKGDVYFDVSKFPAYGKLSNRSVEEQEAGKRDLKSSDDKRHSWDFALWKAAKPGEPAWESPWGKGRPGWHIECSAMSMKYFGETFDIHGGGMDLIFPHHENEIAQSEAATGKPFVKYWLHNGLTRVNTKKMSKSLGNIRVLSELLQQYPGEVIRFFILSTHYRRPIDFSDEEIVKVAKGLQTFYRLFDRVRQITGHDPFKWISRGDLGLGQALQSANVFCALWTNAKENFSLAMDNDFNTADAIAALYGLANAANHFIEEANLTSDSSAIDKEVLVMGASVIIKTANLIGLFENPPEEKFTDQTTDDLIKLLIDVRNAARAQKQFTISDMVRDRLKDLHVQLKDGKDGTTWETIP
ncbi:MAG: cysteine--tRNA ligase [Phycisphaerae bacterium]